ncbi:alpha/beta hydrolase [Lichenihabitans sp. PAMC28606]|uniref:alpha/beta fold hydrolase n=1 Tax=Lichenihabitans sp. PAMC28606 TaxID=2880932 RepID=UPI001D09D6F6|nr:alpha/beta hydrolase [Lichenihabitans sp. PAMC28606]UDL95810.1 alpha/beta hydrolase [Lichenihabitans sp. PAMC28606]
MTTGSAKPTIVLVHGAVEDSSLWTHGVIQGLTREGYPFKVFSNPLRGVAHDAAYLRSLLDMIEGPVLLVSHAYGGAVISQAGDDPKVKGLIYAGSPMPAAGESTNDCLDRFPGGDFATSVDLTPYTLPDRTTGINLVVKADRYRYLLAADVPEDKLALMIATQRPISLAALNEKLTSAAWTSKPSWQIRPLLDPVIPQAEFAFEADRARSQVIELRSSHAIPVTFPDVVVDVIGQATRTVTP